MSDHPNAAEADPWPRVRASGRVLRSHESLARLQRDVEGWLNIRETDERFRRFGKHLDLLRTVLIRMLAAIDADLDVTDEEDRPSGAVYERCRQVESRITVVRRVFEWYSTKYDQRIDEIMNMTLRAADEVIRSCWAEPFTLVGRQPPTGPLAYLDPRYDATATPRSSVPSDLRAVGDEVNGHFVRELPIPVISLPLASTSDPWWLVLAAHETGHHIQLDLAPDLAQATREALAAATSAAPGDNELAISWAGWGLEAFSDSRAILCVGTSAAWAVDELQHATPSRRVTALAAGDRYPPPAVRTALLGEIARCAGVAEPGAGSGEVARWLETVAGSVNEVARAIVARHLELAPRAARALIELSVNGVPLREVAGWTPTRFALDGPVQRWAVQLAQPEPIIPGRAAPEAARLGIAASVLAYRMSASESGDLARVRANLSTFLASCGPPEVLAGEPVQDVGALADRLTDLPMAVGDDMDSSH
jgi:hypothetical protein